MRRGTPGIPGILVGVIGVSVLMTVLYGDLGHWIPVILAIIVSLRTLKSTNR